MGDPAGIGPEIAAKALGHEAVYSKCRPVVIGDAGVMQRASGFVGSGAVIHSVAKVAEAVSCLGTIDVFDLRELRREMRRWRDGSARRAGGRRLRRLRRR